LSEACRRVTESEAWKACREKFPAATDYRYRHESSFYRNESLFEPNNRDRVFLLGNPLRHVLLSTLPGADEKDKLNRVFKSAPPWVIWFTFAGLYSQIAGSEFAGSMTSIGQLCLQWSGFSWTLRQR
jgi:hypothetical protein